MLEYIIALDRIAQGDLVVNGGSIFLHGSTRGREVQGELGCDAQVILAFAKLYSQAASPVETVRVGSVDGFNGKDLDGGGRGLGSLLHRLQELRPEHFVFLFGISSKGEMEGGSGHGLLCGQVGVAQLCGRENPTSGTAMSGSHFYATGADLRASAVRGAASTPHTPIRQNTIYRAGLDVALLDARQNGAHLAAVGNVGDNTARSILGASAASLGTDGPGRP
jgi:hypothetical protein